MNLQDDLDNYCIIKWFSEIIIVIISRSSSRSSHLKLYNCVHTWLDRSVVYSYADACRKIFNTIKTSGHSSLEKYTSHFIERVVCERELETEQRLQHIEPPTLLTITAFLSRSPGLFNRGPWGPASAGTWFSFQHLLSNWSEFPVVGVISLFYAHSIQPDDSQCLPLISWYLRPDASVIYTGAFLLLTAWPGRRSICNRSGKLEPHNFTCIISIR